MKGGIAAALWTRMILGRAPWCCMVCTNEYLGEYRLDDVHEVVDSCPEVMRYDFMVYTPGLWRTIGLLYLYNSGLKRKNQCSSILI